MPITKITTTQILDQPINATINFKSDKSKYGNLNLNGEGNVYIQFNGEVCVMDAVTQYGASLKFDKSSNVYRAIMKIEDSLDEGYTVNRRVKTFKGRGRQKEEIQRPLLFIDLDETCEIYQNGERVDPEQIKEDSTHTGLIKVKWVYRDLSTGDISLKLVVVVTKFSEKEPFDLLSLLTDETDEDLKYELRRLNSRV